MEKKDVIETIRQIQQFDELQKRYFDIGTNLEMRKDQLERHMSEGVAPFTPEEYAERATKAMIGLEKDITKLAKDLGESPWCLT